MLAKTLIVLFVVSGLPLWPQTTGTIFGTVSDSSGSVIQGAKITIIQVDTNVTRTATSTAEGSYSVPFVPIGTYRVEVDAAGFKKFEQTGIVLDVNRNARVDARMQVGQVSETVEVSSDAPLIETRAPALGLTVQNKEIDSLPLVDRDLYSLVMLAPGVDTTGEASDNFGTPQRVTLINGSPNSGMGSVNYNLDGGTNMNGLRNTGDPAPNPDAVEQFRVITNGYPAQYGRFPSGVVDIVTKSGTNRIHGSLFEFFRNTKLNANRWTPGLATLRKDPLHRNQFGGSVGGPIVKNRSFYFFSYSGLRQRESYYANTAQPFTAAERLGDLSATSGTAPVDPLNGSVAFPGRQIPVSRFDPVAKRIMDQYIPPPNLALNPGTPLNLFETQVPHPKDSDDATLKLDHTLTDAHRLSGSWFRSTGEDLTGLLGNLPWVQRDFVWTHNAFNVSETWTVSANKVNDFHLQYKRSFGGRVNLPAISLGDLGSKYQIQGAPSLPQIQVSGRFNMNSAIPGAAAGSNLYELRDTLNITKGRHSISVGAQMMLEKMVHDTELNNYGNFSFSASTGSRTRNVVGDYLLGLPTSMKQDTPVVKIDDSWYLGPYFQDDIRVRPGLIVNLGVRYDLQLPITDRHDRLLTFIPGKQSTLVPNAPMGLLFATEQGIPRGIVGTDWNNISPRIGIAWDPFGDAKTSIRSGFGIFSGSAGGNPINSSTDTQPFSLRQTFDNVKSLSDPYGSLPGGASPFPYNYSPGNARFLLPANVQGIGLDYRLPYSYQMSFSIQRQLGKDTSFMVAYNSTLVHKIPVSPDQNYPVYRTGATTSNVNDRRPYLPGILSSVNMLSSILNSSFHGVQFTGEKRYSRNFQVRGFLTIGKGIDPMNTQNSTGQNPSDWNNIAVDRGRANNDRKYTFTVSGTWDLNYFKKAPQAVRAVAGGWSVSFIGTARSGQGLSISSGVDTLLLGLGSTRADIIGDPFLSPNRPRNEVIDMWFDPKAFARPRDGTLGTSARNFLDGPGMKNVDLSIRRAFRIREEKLIEFRGDATNAFNLVNLSSPGVSINSLANVGRITTALQMRKVQLGLRLKF
jgi:hypothetical protein